jgi:hypothetical protein
MAKGRRVPPFVPITRVNPPIEEMAQVVTRPGLYMLSFEHNDGCPTIISQRWDDCTCGDDVDHRLLRYAPEQEASAR